MAGSRYLFLTQTFQKLLVQFEQPVYASITRSWSFGANAFCASETSLVQKALNQTAICNMIAPTDAKELQTSLGLTNYVGRFTPNLAAVPAPFIYFCKTNVPYDWGPAHDAAFSNLKKAI